MHTRSSGNLFEHLWSTLEKKRGEKGGSLIKSLLLRSGYFFTLMFASALAGAACVPLVAPDLFGLPAVAGGSILVAGLVCACGLILRWPTIHGLTLTYLGVLIVLSLFSAFTLPSPLSVSWIVLGSVCAILLLVFLRSRMLRAYLART